MPKHLYIEQETQDVFQAPVTKADLLSLPLALLSILYFHLKT